jgi:UDP-N-acetyl-D-galactosamine dehydrogenase
MILDQIKIAVIGLGYVGLPLAVEFGKKRDVVGFDVNLARLNELKNNIDLTLETSRKELEEAKYLSFSEKIEDIKSCNCYIITVPTPVDEMKLPDLTMIKAASKTIGNILKKGDIVVYESTVYPGATEEVCVPILEKYSNLKFNKDFYCGYSPERINPGDKEHRLTNIIKITSGSTPESAEIIDSLYNEIVEVGTHKAASIRVAEAAKVIENTQRDLNIALMNELSIIFDKLNIDTLSVLEAAGTKWNFLPFRPGLVGGHCIGVDPYYLTYKSKEAGHDPQIILYGRNLNDGMSKYIAEKMINMTNGISTNNDKKNILILGLTFKENCPDIRNTKVVDVINSFSKSKYLVDVYDPWAKSTEAEKEYGIKLIDRLESNKYDGIILCVSHREFKEMGIDKIKSLGKNEHILFDLKSVFDKDQSDFRL